MKKSEFTGREGNLIKGKVIYCVYEEEGTEGLATYSAFLSERVLKQSCDLAVGLRVGFTFNRYRKVEKVFAIES